MEPPPFQRFLDAHRDAVYRYLVFAAGPQEAEDLFQETFLAALRAYGRLRDGSNLRAWALRIAHRKVIDAARARSRAAVPMAEPPEVAATPPAPVVDGLDPELWARVRALPAKQRGAVLLRFVADLDHEQIGHALECSPEAARRNLHVGLEQLRKAEPGTARARRSGAREEATR